MRFIDLENIYLDVKIIILCALLSKLWSKTSFCIMAANVTHSRTSHVQTAQDIFWFVESPRPKLPCVKIWWRFVQQEPRYGPKCDFTHLWPWKVKVKHEVNKILHCNAHTTHDSYTHKVRLTLTVTLSNITRRWLETSQILDLVRRTDEYTCEVSLKSYGQLFRYGEQIVARKRRRRIKRNSLTDVDILWRKLRHEGEIWRKSDQHVIWRSFPELSFGISWGSIHWAVIEIEPPTLRLKSWELLY